MVIIIAISITSTGIDKCN